MDMPKQILFCLFLLLSSFSSEAQEKIYFGFDANIGSEISLFDSGEYALAGSSNFNGASAALIIFFDACGDTLWSRQYFDGLNFNKVLRIQNDNEFLWLAATFGTNVDTAIALLKIDKQGQVVLSKSITAPLEFVWYQFHIDVNGDLYFTGNSTSTTGFSNTVLKLNSQAQEIHAFQYSDIFIWGMSTPALSGGILNTTGRTIYKLDANGNIEWITRLYGFQQSSIPPISLPDGYLVFHKYIGAIDRTAAVKLDLQGNVVWSSRSFMHLNANSATVDSDGHILMSFTDYFFQQIGWGILELDENGRFVRSDYLPTSTGDQVYDRDLKLISEDEMIMTGLVNFNLASYQALTIRRLKRNLSDLEECQATSTTLPADTTYTRKDTITPSFSPDRYSGFSIQNFNFPSGPGMLTENLFCGADPTGIEFELGPDRFQCPLDTTILRTGLPSSAYSFLWSNGSTADSVLVQEPGLYWCEVQSNCGNESFRDSILISFYPTQEIEISSLPEFPVLGDTIYLEANLPTSEITWQIGDSSYFGNPISLISYPKMSEGITASYRDSNACEIRDSLFPIFADGDLFMPNAFTPNGDGLNDVFGPDPAKVYDFEMQVFDRFGKGQADLKNQQWDGGDLPRGSYVYILRYQLIAGGELRVIRGIVNLIR